MPTPLTVEVPLEVDQHLQEWAAREGTTPEALVGVWLTRRVLGAESDPLLRWAGAVESDAADAAERHDAYLGAALSEDLRGEAGGTDVR
jgi:hypothetical protein